MTPPTDSKDRGILVLLAAAILFFAQDYEYRQIEERNIALSLEMVFFGLASFSLLFLAARATLPGWADRYT
ncbi:MAG: hypothetical protein HYX89_07785, partial [Chloroflexi bacterium]|nr:hypothetical protein [Chloroflexota bacterium]